MAEGRDIVISAEAAERILRLRDSRAAMYYLHLLCGGGAGAESTAAALGWSEAETLAAQAALSAAGVLPRAPSEDAAEAERPAYSARDITDRLEGDPAFSALIGYTQSRIARTLSPSDIAKLLEIYDHLGMPAGEIMLLVSYCMSRERRRKGEGARLAMWAVEREAYRWLREGVDTEEKAESYVRSLEERERSLDDLRRLLQIHGRALSATERKYLEKWSQSGLSPDAIYDAYDRTVIATGSLKWQYMDKIIDDWAQNGLPERQPQPKQEAPQRSPRPRPQQGDDGESAAELLRRRREREADDR